MNFEAYLEKKSINREQFRAELPGLYTQLANEYEQSSTASFDGRKKFLINSLRLQFVKN